MAIIPEHFRRIGCCDRIQVIDGDFGILRHLHRNPVIPSDLVVAPGIYTQRAIRIHGCRRCEYQLCLRKELSQQMDDHFDVAAVFRQRG